MPGRPSGRTNFGIYLFISFLTGGHCATRPQRGCLFIYLSPVGAANRSSLSASNHRPFARRTTTTSRGRGKREEERERADTPTLPSLRNLAPDFLSREATTAPPRRRQVRRGGDRERRDPHALHAAVALQFFFKAASPRPGRPARNMGFREPRQVAAPAEFVQRAVRLGAIEEPARPRPIRTAALRRFSTNAPSPHYAPIRRGRMSVPRGLDRVVAVINALHDSRST